VTSGEVSSLTGIGDNTRYLQISAAVQPGNSGGPLLDMSGNVLGVVTGKLDGLKVAAATGDIPQNVNFAINASTLLSFLDAVGVEVERRAEDRILPGDQIAAAARRFTVKIECYSERGEAAVARAKPFPSLKVAAARAAAYAAAPKGKAKRKTGDTSDRGADLYVEAELLENGQDASKLPKALKLYKQAAELGYVPAQHKLGVFYFLGKGAPRDYAQAAKWHRKAAAKGDAHAQYDLGLLYEWGKGVPKNRREAIAWYTKAAGNGYPDAEQALQRLGVAH
jgi:TPR repeat protein